MKKENLKKGNLKNERWENTNVNQKKTFEHIS